MTTLKTLLATSFLLLLALITFAAPNAFEAKTATHATLATVYFEPGERPAQLVVADVTSDKAASVLSWRVGTNALTILKAVPSTAVSNIFTTVGYGINQNSNLVSVTAAGLITAHTSGTNILRTNTLVTLDNVLTTNLAVGDNVRERTSTYFNVVSTSSTNVILLSTNSAVTNATLYLLQGPLNQYATNQLTSFTTNAGYLELNFTNAFAWTPQRMWNLTTNLYTNVFAAALSENSLVVSNTAGGLAATDTIVINPATGGTFVNTINTVGNYVYLEQWIGAATGVALAAGDRLFLLSPAVTTPVGNTTVRLFGNPIRILPANVPAVLSVDGTSAVTINNAIMQYR